MHENSPDIQYYTKLTRKNKKLTIHTHLNFAAYEKKVGNFDDMKNAYRYIGLQIGRSEASTA